MNNPIQSDSATNIYFSSSEYWGYWTPNAEYNLTVDQNYATEGRQYPYVYGDYKNAQDVQQNKLYPFINAYVTYLNENGLNNANGKLLSYEQLINLKNNYNNPTWLYDADYWLGSYYESTSFCMGASEDSIVCGSDEVFMWGVSNKSLTHKDSNWDKLGIRPVITISTSEI